MPGISKSNPVTTLKAAANGGRGTGSALDPVKINGVNQLPNQAPPKADTATAKQVFNGLMKELNDYEKSLCSGPNGFKTPNEYSIEFLPPDLANAKITKPGGTNKSATPINQDGSARNQLPETNSMAKEARIQKFQAGTPIVQIIDQILRNSTYITDQANTTIDETTGKIKEQKPIGNDVTWFKINVSVTPIGTEPDPKRQDFAYRVKYLITPYAISDMLSQYFPRGNFRGLHKTYSYFFTGENTQVIHFEQQFNKLYVQTITNPNINLSTMLAATQREIVPRVVQGASEQSSQGADGKTNEVSANAAEYLYSVGDMGNIKLKIVGDPAWLQQGEISSAADPKNFTFNPFNSDGTINFDASQVFFSINWNQPVDYDYSKGFMPVGAKNKGEVDTSATGVNTQETANYRATRVVSRFSHGRFEQDLEGYLFLAPPPPSGDASSAARNAAQPQAPKAADTRTPTQIKGQNITENYGLNTLGLPKSVVNNVIGSKNPASSISPSITNSALGFSNPTPYTPSTAPNSNGSVTPGNSQNAPLPLTGTSVKTFADDVSQRKGLAGLIKNPQLGNKEY